MGKVMVVLAVAFLSLYAASQAIAGGAKARAKMERTVGTETGKLRRQH